MKTRRGLIKIRRGTRKVGGSVTEVILTGSDFQEKYVGVGPTRIKELFELAKKSNKLSDQMNYFSQAEKVLMADPPIIPLWYKGDYEIVYSEVRNLYFNALNQLVFTRVYKKPWTKEEYLEKMKHEK